MGHNKNYLADDTNIEEEEKYIKDHYKRKIYLHEEPKNVDDIIEKLLWGESTIYKRGGLHCASYKCRSIVDMYRLCLTYFPDTKLTTVINKLKKCDKFYVGYGYCSNIKRFRFGSGPHYKDHFIKVNK